MPPSHAYAPLSHTLQVPARRIRAHPRNVSGAHRCGGSDHERERSRCSHQDRLSRAACSCSGSVFIAPLEARFCSRDLHFPVERFPLQQLALERFHSLASRAHRYGHVNGQSVCWNMLRQAFREPPRRRSCDYFSPPSRADQALFRRFRHTR